MTLISNYMNKFDLIGLVKPLSTRLPDLDLLSPTKARPDWLRSSLVEESCWGGGLVLSEKNPPGIEFKSD